MERFAEARDALLVLEATATTETVLVNSRVNLVVLAARSDDRKMFTEMRSLLHNVELPSEVRVNFLIESARAYMQSNLPALAIALDGERKVLIRVHRDGVFKVPPVGVGSSIGLDDQVARLQTCLLSGGARLNSLD